MEQYRDEESGLVYYGDQMSVILAQSKPPRRINQVPNLSHGEFKDDVRNLALIPFFTLASNVGQYGGFTPSFYEAAILRYCRDEGEGRTAQFMQEGGLDQLVEQGYLRKGHNGEEFVYFPAGKLVDLA